MDRGESGHFPQTEDTGIEANDKEGCSGVEGSANSLRTWLIEEMAAVDTPAGVSDGVVDTVVQTGLRGGGCVENVHFDVRVVLIYRLLSRPSEDCSVSRYGIDLKYKLGFTEEHDALTYSLLII